ncbi:MAG: adenylate/guanylate cyclase domain-containing protein [Deltaproteobacteria bacterium]|nr:adenylate/guanylate cyclase domain-containing protein [Deltaproteobacteria bacterium]
MERLKKTLRITPMKITLFVVLIALILFFMDVSFFQFMEFKALDIRMLSRGNADPGGETVIVAVDEKSLAELGQWPWPRATMSRLIDALKKYNVKAIGLDVVFAEPEKNEGLKAIKDIAREVKKSHMGNARLENLLDQKIRSIESDDALARSIREAQNVTLGYFFLISPSEAQHLTPQMIEKSKEKTVRFKYPVIQFNGRPNDKPILHTYSPVSNIDIISEAGANGGYFNAFPDPDGAYRRSLLLVKYGEHYYPSLAVALLMQYLDWPMCVLRIGELGVEGITLKDLEIPVNESGSLLINYLGPVKTFPHYSATDIIHHRLAPDVLTNKIAIVGATAIGIFDMRVTPFSPVFPGVEIHATIVDNILHQNFLHHSGWTEFIDFFSIIAFGLVMGIVIPKVRAIRGVCLCLAIIGIYVIANTYILTHFNIWLNVVYPILTMMTIYLGITVYRYIREERERKKIRGAFQYYLASSVINEMLKDPSKLKLSGDKKDLSVLFSDIRGFTSISEKLSPEELVHLLNEYLTAMTDIVFKYDGLLDKYMGDAIMAVYGAPLEQPDHALRACRTALDMVKELKKLQVKWNEEGRPTMDIGIGINSGDMVVGNMGSLMRFDYTVMGDSVNLGSRLEGTNKEYGTNIIISEFTYQAVKDVLFCRELDSVRVKGKIRPVRIYELLGDHTEAGQWREFTTLFEEALALYKAAKWDEAIAAFQMVLDVRSGDPPSILYIKRCRELKENPPAGSWDGVYTMTRK